MEEAPEWGGVGRKLLIVLAAVVLAAAVAHLYGLSPSALLPSCTVGIPGTEVNVTVQGFTAGSECDSFKAREGWVDGEPHGTLVCRHAAGAITYTVRDLGVHKLLGSEVCSRLARMSGTP